MKLKIGGYMKSDVEQLSTYKSVHLNKNNLKTHFVGIPAIIWAVMALMSLLRFPLEGLDFHVTFAMIFVLGVLVYYFFLNTKLAMGTVLFILPILASAEILVRSHDNSALIALGVFTVGWIFQFIGHGYEKAKPAFVDDINQLLIGPFFLMAELFFILGQEKALEDEITPSPLKKENSSKQKKENHCKPNSLP
jgi:uncharacterized membrane protein YGL010W